MEEVEHNYGRDRAGTTPDELERLYGRVRASFGSELTTGPLPCFWPFLGRGGPVRFFGKMALFVTPVHRGVTERPLGRFRTREIFCTSIS